MESGRMKWGEIEEEQGRVKDRKREEEDKE